VLPVDTVSVAVAEPSLSVWPLHDTVREVPGAIEAIVMVPGLRFLTRPVGAIASLETTLVTGAVPVLVMVAVNVAFEPLRTEAGPVRPRLTEGGGGAAGALIVTTTVSVAVAPRSSVTVSDTVYVPTDCHTENVGVLPSIVFPALTTFQFQPTIVPSGSDDAAPV
jgi:hypothetical protein